MIINVNVNHHEKADSKGVIQFKHVFHSSLAAQIVLCDLPKSHENALQWACT